MKSIFSATIIVFVVQKEQIPITPENRKFLSCTTAFKKYCIWSRRKRYGWSTNASLIVSQLIADLGTQSIRHWKGETGS